jgi:hypothetical protein
MPNYLHKMLIGSVVVLVFSLGGCGEPTDPADESDSEPTLVEEIAVTGFDPDGEPVIKKWSDGSIWLHFQAMPPFFAEDDGTEADYEDFETTIQDSLGVTVIREDREVFVINDPNPDTAERAKTWLETFHKNEG